MLNTPMTSTDIPKKEDTSDFTFNIFKGLCIDFVIIWLLIKFDKWAFETVSGLNTFVNITRFIGIIIAVILIICYLSKKSGTNAKHKNDLRNIAKENKEKAKISKINRDKARTLSAQIPWMNAELTEVGQIRSNLYDINWIPLRYRNIETIYYIYDMITTSAIGIDEALKYYLSQEANNKLDEILQKLDTVISQQSRIIMNQAVIQAQNEQLVRSTEESVNKLAAIEENSQAAAEYAQLASRYCEANAYLKLADYFKNN